MKKIKLDQTDIDQLVGRFRKDMTSKKGIPETVSYKVNVSVGLPEEEKVKVIFEDEAYKKMYALIDKCVNEIGWWGLVERTSEKEFLIKDIIVPPQTVTGVTVTTDDKAYPEWEEALDDDTFNAMKFYGHSHVNMSTSPSSVDTTFYNNRLQNERRFLILGIFNKRRELWMNIYDVENNILYEEDDISVTYYVSEADSWAEQQIKEKVTKPVYTPPKTNYYGGKYPYDDYDDTPAWYKKGWGNKK